MDTAADVRKIGIMGFGIVGDALHHSLMEHKGYAGAIVIYDPFKEETKDTKAEELKDCELVFIGVPTPEGKDGKQDPSIVGSSLKLLSDIAYEGIAVIKSTLLPVHLKSFSAEFPNLKLASNPEFLTERTARDDFESATFHIVGSNDDDVLKVLCGFYSMYWPQSSCYATSLCAAMYEKYLANNWFALKVSFMNEAHKLWEKVGDDADWDELRTMMALDERIGYTHTQVPGPDGQFGFGGKCFPKDAKAFIGMAEEAGVSMKTIEAALSVNADVRKPLDE